MVRNEFGSFLYRTTTDMLDAIAEEWLSAGGANSKEMQREFLAEASDAELAIEAIDGWGLNLRGDFYFDDPSHMEFNEYTADDLAAAFARIRARIQAAH